MKIIVNKTRSTVVLADGRVTLAPEGMPGDRKEIKDEVAEYPDVQRFANDLKKVALLSPEEFAKRSAKASAPKNVTPDTKAEDKAKAKAKAEAEAEAEAKAKAEAEAEAEAKAKAEAEAEAEAKAEAEAEAGSETSSKKKKRRKG